jgi:hypothetical protein
MKRLKASIRRAPLTMETSIHFPVTFPHVVEQFWEWDFAGIIGVKEMRRQPEKNRGNSVGGDYQFD